MSLRFGDRVMARLDDLAAFSAAPDRLTRLYLTAPHAAAAAAVRDWMTEADMSGVAIDAIGNVVGRYEGREPGLPAFLLGSHIDTVRDAGRYDGALGVVAAIAAVSALAEAGERLPFAVEVVAFGDEEGVRFPTTLGGSRALAGTFDAAALTASDADGVPLAEALRAWGGEPEAVSDLARRPEDVLGYLEVHIEQGPVLESLGLPVGIVTAISGASRFRVELRGSAGHAGTVPMALRRDALAAAAEMILAVERRAAAAAESGLVATVGCIEARPGAPNVIPGEVSFTIDLRAPADADRRRTIDDVTAALGTLASRRQVALKVERTYDEPAATCDPGLIRTLDAALRDVGVAPHRLASGAGHDAAALAALCPMAMLFVRCRGGISHHPAEAITAADADTAVRVLLAFLRRLPAPAGSTPS